MKKIKIDNVNDLTCGKNVFKEKARGHILRDKSHTEAKHEQMRRGSTLKSNTSNGQKNKSECEEKNQGQWLENR